MSYGKTVKNFEIAKTSPTAKWTDPASYATADKVATVNEFSFTNQINKPASPGSAHSFASASHEYTSFGSNIGAFDGLTTTFTLVAWLKMSSPGASYRDIISKQEHYALNVKDSVFGTYSWGGSAGFRSSGVNIADSAWHLCVVSVSSGTSNGSKLYVDAVQQGGDFTYTISSATSNDMAFCTAFPDGSNSAEDYNGTVGGIMIFNRQLSGAEITTIYNSGVGVYPSTSNSPFNSGLVGMWRMQEGTGTTIADSSGNGNTGTLVNTPTWVTGIMPDAGGLSTAKFISSQDGSGAGENGIHIFGVNDGRGVINGATTEERIAGTAYGTMSATGLKTFTRGFMSDGGSDIIQDRVQAHSSQTANLSTWENSAGTVGASMSPAYLLTTANALLTGLTASRAVATDGSKQLVSSATTATELGYVNGVTSAIQTQLDAKLASATAATTYFKVDQSTPQTVTEGATMPTFQAADADADVGFNLTVPTWDTWRIMQGGGDSPDYHRSLRFYNVTNTVAALDINRDGTSKMVAAQVKAGTSTAYVNVGGSRVDFYTSVGNVGTGEDDLYTTTLAASILGTNGDKLEAEYGGVFVSSATATRQIKLYFAGTAIFDTGALTLSLSSAWTMYASIIRVSSTVVRYMVSLTTQGAALAAYTAVGELTGLTLSNTAVLKITGEAAGVGAATDDIVAKMGTVEWKPAA